MRRRCCCGGAPIPPFGYYYKLETAFSAFEVPATSPAGDRSVYVRRGVSGQVLCGIRAQYPASGGTLAEHYYAFPTGTTYYANAGFRSILAQGAAKGTASLPAEVWNDYTLNATSSWQGTIVNVVNFTALYFLFDNTFSGPLYPRQPAPWSLTMTISRSPLQCTA